MATTTMAVAMLTPQAAATAASSHAEQRNDSGGSSAAVAVGGGAGMLPVGGSDPGGSDSTMSGEALLSAICEDPENDTPRLVYADWLEEHGESERAELIRTQIELARGAKGKRYTTLVAREAELLQAHAAEWAEPLQEFILDWSSSAYVFRRGFVEEINTLGETLGEQGAELFAAAPIRAVRLPDEEDFSDLAKCKHLLRLRSIDLTLSGLSSNFGPEELFRSRYLANLTTLLACGHDDNCHLDVKGIRGIVRSKYLGNLKHLDVGDNWFGAEGTIELLKAKNLVSLEQLSFAGVDMQDQGAVAVAGTPWVAQLRQLDLASNSIGERGARALLESPFLEKIELLDLRENLTARSDDEDAEAIRPDTVRALRRRFGKRVLL
jgi:uncharacterized protein (TIGR02996 family)